jgi:hypothetical protein
MYICPYIDALSDRVASENGIVRLFVFLFPPPPPLIVDYEGSGAGDAKLPTFPSKSPNLQEQREMGIFSMISLLKDLVVKPIAYSHAHISFLYEFPSTKVSSIN